MTREELLKKQEDANEDKAKNLRTFDSYGELGRIVTGPNAIPNLLMGLTLLVELQNIKVLLCEIALRLPEPPWEDKGL